MAAFLELLATAARTGLIGLGFGGHGGDILGKARGKAKDESEK